MKLLEMRNYLRYVELLGTAHWSRRSIVDAATTVDRLRPQAVCIELDKRRFDFLRRACFECPRLKLQGEVRVHGRNGCFGESRRGYLVDGHG
ncbi:hypothetical protein MUP05_01645 [Candidatus Bathyarchaeota archaeon]|nr:hypothetical protein [Candidatus Bathyarchaeota archaeon]